MSKMRSSERCRKCTGHLQASISLPNLQLGSCPNGTLKQLAKQCCPCLQRHMTYENRYFLISLTGTTCPTVMVLTTNSMAMFFTLNTAAVNQKTVLSARAIHSVLSQRQAVGPSKKNCCSYCVVHSLLRQTCVVDVVF